VLVSIVVNRYRASHDELRSEKPRILFLDRPFLRLRHASFPKDTRNAVIGFPFADSGHSGNS
jgi:hypothetical protein